MKKNVLIIAWEYPGVNSQQGSALARRIGQVARGFSDENWEVNVIHRDHINENIEPGKFIVEYVSSGKVKRYPIKGPGLSESKLEKKNALVRKLITTYYVLFKGDRSANWALEVIKFLKEGNSVPTPDLIIGFYTPRGPLLAARFASEFFNCPWFADLQDPLDQGLNKKMGWINFFWAKRVLKNASLITHVSPEWAAESKIKLDKEVITLRHAIPIKNCSQVKEENFSRSKINILYAGSLNAELQPIDALIKAIHSLNSSGSLPLFELRLAAQKRVYDAFINKLKALNYKNDFINWLGWLDSDKLEYEYVNADCLVVVPWNSKSRIGVPSKLFEYLAYNTPILIAGHDSGGIASLLKELEYPNVICENEEQICSALVKLTNNDFSMTLRRSSCKNLPSQTLIVQTLIEQINRLNGGQ